MEGMLTKGQQRATAVLRIAIGSVFLTAGLEKALGATPFDATGFLKGATAGIPWLGEAAKGVVYNPTHDLWVSLAGNAALMPVINWMVVSGEILIGLALVLGLFTRFAAIAGTLMVSFFFVASWDLSHGIVNSQLLDAVVTAFVGIMGAGRYYGLDEILEKAGTVQHTPQLKYVLG
jgi:thiosulfate dehydrogenase (quinone) large subunit